MFGPGGPSLYELTVEALSSTREGYDQLAPRFDTTPFRTPDAVLARWAAYVAEGPRPKRALDICCGTGAAIRHLAPLADEVTGVDFSPGMLDEARRRLADVPNARLVEADWMTWEPDRTFDLATSFGAFGHFDHPDLPAFVHRVRNALSPGGRFVFVTAPRPSPARVRYWLARGFNLVMRARNVVRPPFVMYYLTFTLDEAIPLLESAGFTVTTAPLGWERRPELALVDARRD